MGGGETVGPECQAVRDAASDYLDGHVGGEARSGFDAHLDYCAGCVRFLEGLTATLGLLRTLHEESVSDREEATAVRSYEEYYPEPELPEDLHDWTPVKQAWGNLADLSSGERVLAIDRGERDLLPWLCDWLVVRARRTSLPNPDRAVVLGQTAVYIARKLSNREQAAKRLFASLQALAWCLVSRRDFVPAASVLRELEGLTEMQEVDWEERARFLATRGLYHCHTGQFGRAEALLRQALDLRHGKGSRRELVCALVNMAGTALSGGKTERALALCREGEKLLSVEKDPPRLQRVLYSNLVLALCEAGLAEEARRVLPKSMRLARAVGGWYPALYAIWLEGTVCRAEGHLERAGEIFESVRREFLRRGHLVWYVEASLDLSRVYLQRGLSAELSLLASELLSTTQGVDVDVRVRSAVGSFADAVRQSSLTSQVVGSIAIALSSTRVSQRY